MGPAVQSTPIPQRIAPLRFRQPAFLWTPAAIALGLGWPALMLRDSNAMAMTTLITGAIAFAAGFVTLTCAYIFGRAPRSRGDVIQHFLVTGIIAAIAAPFVLTGMLDAVAASEHTSTGLRGATAYAMMPLAVLLGLPVAFFYGLTFSFVALVKPQRDASAPASSYHGRDVRHSA